MYNNEDYTVVAQRQIAQRLKQTQSELIVLHLDRVYKTNTNTHGPLMSWSTHIKEEIVNSILTGVRSRKLIELVATFLMPSTFSFNLFRNEVYSFAKRVEVMDPPSAVNVVSNEVSCFRCGVASHIRWGCLTSLPLSCYKCGQ